MSEHRGWLRPDMFRIGPSGELPVVSVTRLPPELGGSRGPEQPLPPRLGTAGEPGFGGSDEPGFSFGSVHGYRYWAVDPAEGILLGMHATWEPGENNAACLSGGVIDGVRVHGKHEIVPQGACFCGFYAYWQLPPPYPVPPSMVAVPGVIEGWGLVLPGSKGFRCQVAKVVAIAWPGTRYDEASARLAWAYPDVFLFWSADAMAAEFPPDERYGPG